MVNNNPAQLTKKQKEVLDGLLLGDGCLYIGKSNINPLLTVGRAEKDLEYLKYQYNIFKNLCSSKGIICSNKFDKRRNKTYYGYKFRTRALKVFLNHYSKWYINGVKSLPQDIRITPTVLANWFCDDGSIIRKKDRNGKETKARIIKISTHNFLKSETELLANTLTNMFDVKFSIFQEKYKYSSNNPNYNLNLNRNWFILTYTEGSIQMYNYMKDSFPTGMDRKLNIFKEVCH